MRRLCMIIFLSVFGVYAQTPYSTELVSQYEMGKNAFESGDFSQALNHFNTCVSIDSSCFEAYLNIAQIQYNEANYKACLNTCDQAKKIRPFDPRLTSRRGQTYFKTNDFPNAEIILKRAISLGENTAENNLFLAYSLSKQNHYEEAIYYLDKVISMTPKQIEAWAQRGDLYYKLARYDSAQNDFEHALRLNPENPGFHYNLARAQLADSLVTEALSSIEKGLNSATRAERVNLLLLKGNYEQQSGDSDKAMQSFSEAYQIEQNNALVLLGQAAVLIDTESYESAIEKCNLALDIDPKLTEAYFNRGIAHEMVRKIDEACNDWQRAFVLGSQKAIDYLNGPVCNE